MPLTDHVTVVSVEFVTVGVKVARWLGESVAAPGETLTLTLLVIVTVAEAVTAPPDGGVAVAWMVAGLAAGRVAGAV
jgi:CBS-domain-containing membrane protein